MAFPCLGEDEKIDRSDKDAEDHKDNDYEDDLGEFFPKGVMEFPIRTEVFP